MPRSRPNRPRSSGCRSRSPTRSSPGSRFSPSGAAPAAGEGERRPDRQGAQGSRRDPLLPSARAGRGREPGDGQGAGRRRRRRCRADRSQRRRSQGRSVRADVAQRIFDSSGGNRAIAEQELAKFALYLDASPAAPATLDHDIIDALGAAADEGDLGRLADSAIGGDAAALESELARLHTMGMEGVTLIRALLRRMALLARLRAEVDSGRSPGAVMASSGKSIFFKEKDRIEAQLRRWPSDLLAKAIARLAEAERQVKSSGGVGPIAADVELFAVCRQAARLR